MTVRRSALRAIALLLIVIALPSVSAAIIEQEYLESDVKIENMNIVYRGSTGYTQTAESVNNLVVSRIEDLDDLSSVWLKIRYEVSDLPVGRSEVGYKIKDRDGNFCKSGHAAIYKSYIRNDKNQITQTEFTIFFLDWDNSGLTGPHNIEFDVPFVAEKCIFNFECTETGNSNVALGEFFNRASHYEYNTRMYMAKGSTTGRYYAWNITVISSVQWRNKLYVENNTERPDEYYKISLKRYANPSTFSLYAADNTTIFTNTAANDLQRIVGKTDVAKIEIVSPTTTYTQNLLPDSGDPDDPGDPGESPTLRTGSVIMTDHNGTSISGFEVTAVNHYTGEEYTVSTDTDVAVISLPMDRTVEIRNPQTGVYEEAPVGYYRFYGQKPGYKMLLEEGIKVSVLPEKYSPYKLCEILVTSESGPLSGKHQFQIRSRSDNSILQTGTISAKSRTTGIWYNTTVTNGIATLILPYDTSDAISEYAGQYYVYATSPGYEDSDYGTQITVYPRTIYEVRTILLTPIGGVPTPGNVTLRIQTISETGQGVPNAEIFIAGVYGAGKDVWDTYIASSNGYLEVSVPDDSIYDIVARAAGYYDSSQRIDLFIQDPTIIEMRLYLSGAPTIEPTTEPTGWVTGPPTTQPTGGIPDEDDDSSGFLMEAVRGIGNVFGVGFATAKIILGMLLALSIGFATAKQLRGGAAEFGLGLLGGTMLGILVGLIPVWTIVVLLLVVGLYIGNRYVGGGANNG